MIQRHYTAFKSYHAPWAAVVAFALIVVYLVGAFQQSTVHHFVHGDSAELHSEQNERDACHLAIYHHSDADCGHKLHLSSSDKCSMCHLVFHVDQVLPENVFTLVSDGDDVAVASLYSFVVDANVSTVSARAPPIA